MLEERPVPGEIFKHFKQHLYQVIVLAKQEETGEEMVVYQALYPDFQVYVRPLKEFIEALDCKKYPDAHQVHRFERISDVTRNMDAVESKKEHIEEPKSKKEFVEEPEFEKESVAEPVSPEGEKPVLFEFLDASTIFEKLKIVRERRNEIDDKCICDLAVCMDLIIEKNTLDEKCDELIRCLETMKRFEVRRLR